jgi:C4-type Zn-finger protein
MAKVKAPARRRARKPATRGKSRRKASATTAAAAAVSTTRAAVSSRGEAAADDQFGESQIISSNLSLHQLFEQQARAMIERADLDDEQKQNILVAMSCPCCGAGAMSYTAKLRR